jgi:hypothetical protein
MEDVCPVCGITYKKFRTGMTFADVKAEMYVSSEDSKDWVYKRRRCVLRRWRKIKMALWEYHLKECECKGVEADEGVFVEDVCEY